MLGTSPKQQMQQVPASAPSDCPGPDTLPRRAPKVAGAGALALRGQAQGAARVHPGGQKASGDLTAAPRTCEGVSEEMMEPGSEQGYVVGG